MVHERRGLVLTEQQLPESFEQAIEKLEHIVTRLESGDVPLEEAIDLFQEGMRLSHYCSQKLDQVERKIEMLMEDESGISRKPFPVADEKGE